MYFSAPSFFLMMMSYMNHFFNEQNQPVVNIPALGKVIGSVMYSSASSRQFQAFRGIPYAEPPVGNLRFKDSLAKTSWGEDPLDATKEGPICMQLVNGSSKGQEDCLVLNVYTPSCNFEEDTLLPVMVWIHGGAWSKGSGSGEKDLYGPNYILDRDVVLVTMNYRIGPMGFLSTEDVEAPGNYGLIDQSLALKWVKEHIKHFGGNPDSITIFGESAGGACVEFHLMSPLSKGLFHRAISQSGSTRGTVFTHVGQYTKELAEQLNCSTTSSRELVECLRDKDGKDIIETRKTIQLPYSLGIFPNAFGPRIDSERDSPFLPDYPAKLVAQKLFNSVPFIAGVNQNEGALFGASLATVDGENLKEFNRDPVKSVRFSLGMEKRTDGLEIAEKVYQHYFVNNKNKETYQQYGEMLSDYRYFKFVDESVQAFSQYSENPVYYYYYTHRGQFSLTNRLNVPAEKDFGVVHGDELLYMFTNKLIPPLTKPDDIKIKNMLLDLWTSFAIKGVPQSDFIVDQWDPVINGQTTYLKIDAQSPKLIKGPMPFQPNLTFWNQLL